MPGAPRPTIAADLGGRVLLPLLLPSACGGSGGGGAADASAERIAAVGPRIFTDTRLSASGRQSCASCHDAAVAHGPPNALAAQTTAACAASTTCRGTGAAA